MEIQGIIFLEEGQEDLPCSLVASECIPLPAEPIRVQARWSTEPLAPLAALHLASDGVGPHLCLLPPRQTGRELEEDGQGAKLGPKAAKGRQRLAKRASEALAAEHTACVGSHSALRAQLGGKRTGAAGGTGGAGGAGGGGAGGGGGGSGLELLLAPVAGPAAAAISRGAGASSEATSGFWGYLLPPGAAAAAERALRERQLAVAASLENDGPVVRSYTVRQLEAAVAAARKTRVAREGELRRAELAARSGGGGGGGDGGEADGGRKKKRRRVAEADAADAGQLNATATADVTAAAAATAAAGAAEAALAADLELLRQYIKTGGGVTYGGQQYKARLEKTTMPGGGVLKRRVVRIPLPPPKPEPESNQQPGLRIQEELLALTRSDPADPETSMLVRVRAGWGDLRNLLAGRLDPDLDPGAVAGGGEKKKEKRARAAAGAAVDGGGGAADDSAVAAAARRFDFLPWISPDRNLDSVLALWQILDPEGDVLSHQQARKRLAAAATAAAGGGSGNGGGGRQLPRLHPPTHKTGGSDVDGDTRMRDAAAAAPPPGQDDEEDGEAAAYGALGAPPAALTVVLDERPDAWAAGLQPAVLRLLPWGGPAAEAAAAGDTGPRPAAAAGAELRRACTALSYVYDAVFRTTPAWKLLKRRARELAEGTGGGAAAVAAGLGGSAASLLGGLHRTADVIQAQTIPSLRLPQLPPAAGDGAAAGPTAAAAVPARAAAAAPAAPPPAAAAAAPCRHAAGSSGQTSSLAPSSSRLAAAAAGALSSAAALLAARELLPPLRTLAAFALPYLAVALRALHPGLTDELAQEMQGVASRSFSLIDALDSFRRDCDAAAAAAAANGGGNPGAGGAAAAAAPAVAELQHRYDELAARCRQLVGASASALLRFGEQLERSDGREGEGEGEDGGAEGEAVEAEAAAAVTRGRSKPAAVPAAAVPAAAVPDGAGEAEASGAGSGSSSSSDNGGSSSSSSDDSSGSDESSGGDDSSGSSSSESGSGTSSSGTSSCSSGEESSDGGGSGGGSGGGGGGGAEVGQRQRADPFQTPAAELGGADPPDTGGRDGTTSSGGGGSSSSSSDGSSGSSSSGDTSGSSSSSDDSGSSSSDGTSSSSSGGASSSSSDDSASSDDSSSSSDSDGSRSSGGTDGGGGESSQGISSPSSGG